MYGLDHNIVHSSQQEISEVFKIKFLVLVSFPFQQPDGNVNVTLNNIALQIMAANGLLFEPEKTAIQNRKHVASEKFELLSFGNHQLREPIIRQQCREGKKKGTGFPAPSKL